MLKSYRESMNDLRFTQEEKNSMVDGLMAAMESPKPKHKVLPLRRMVAVGAAAALVLALGVGAAATGVLKSAGEAFAGIFGATPAQTEIIDRIGYPVGASDTVDGITITADAILGDTYSYAIVYTIARTDGEPLAEGIDPNELGYLPMTFEEADSDVGHMGGMHGTSYFYDADPADNAVQYVELRTADGPLQSGTAKVTLQGLCVFPDGDYSNKQTLVSGKWSFKFQFAFEDSSIQLPAGQTVNLDGVEATLDRVELSPLSFLVEYTVPDTRASDEVWSNRHFQNVPISLTMKDGSTVDLSNSGGSVRPQGQVIVCQRSDIFDAILSLDEVASITIGDLTLSVNP